MSLSRPITRSESDALMREFRKMKDRLRKLENQHSPTVPIYNPDFPTDAVDGQIALASTPPDDVEDDSEAVPYYRWSDAWHPFAATPGSNPLRWAWLDNPSTTFDTVETGYFPWDEGGVLFESNIDSDVFSYDLSGEPNGINILQNGVYLIRQRIAWSGDWGPCAIETVFGASAAVFPVIQGWSYAAEGLTLLSSYPGGGAGTFDFWLVSEQLVAVGEVSGPVYPVLVVHNDAPGNSDRTTAAQQLVVRLGKSHFADQSADPLP